MVARAAGRSRRSRRGGRCRASGGRQTSGTRSWRLPARGRSPRPAPPVCLWATSPAILCRRHPRRRGSRCRAGHAAVGGRGWALKSPARIRVGGPPVAAGRAESSERHSEGLMRPIGATMCTAVSSISAARGIPIPRTGWKLEVVGVGVGRVVGGATGVRLMQRTVRRAVRARRGARSVRPPLSGRLPRRPASQAHRD